MASKMYPKFLEYITDGNFDVSTATIKTLLVTADHTYDDANEFVGDISTNEVTGGSYARQTLTISRSTDTSGDLVTFDDSTDPTFSAVPAQSGPTDIGGAIHYVEGTNDADSVLICFQDSTDLAANGSDIVLTLPTNGIFYFSY
jgi:hypothetical protein